MSDPRSGKPDPITIDPVASRDIGRFIRVTRGILRHDKNWVPPLLVERRMHLSNANPYFKHAR